MTNIIQKDREYQQAVSAAFGLIAHLYDSWYQSPMGRYVWSVEIDAVNALLPHRVQEIALEVGVGTGMALSILQNVSSQLVGIDIAWQMLVHAQKKFKKRENVHLVLSDGTSLPIRKNCTDLVLGMTVLEFISERDEFLREINRCLRPGGHLLLGVLTSLNLWAIDRRIRNLIQPNVFRLAKFPSPWQVIRMLYRNGFSQTSYRGSVYAPPFSSTKCLRAFTQLDVKLGTRWLSRALGAFLVFHARRTIPS